MEGFWRDGEYVLVSTLEAELAGQRRQAEKLRRDAERYRWLRDVECLSANWMMLSGEALDAAIDAAMLKTPNVEFSGTPAASSPEAPLERRVGQLVTTKEMTK